MSPVTLKQLKSADFSRNVGNEATRFEHAILTVRVEGDDRGLFRMLDRSHLVNTAFANPRYPELMHLADRTGP